jgi:site-specific recombinase XerD
MIQATAKNVRDTATTTIREMIGSYFRWKDIGRDNENTRRAYRADVTRLAEFIGEDAPADALNRFSLQRFAVDLHASGLADRSRRRILAYARDLVKWACGAGIYSENFALALKLPRIPHTIPKVPTAEEVADLLSGECPASWPERNRCMVELLYCNLRVCELVAINLDDLTADTLLVKGKGKRERTAFLTPTALKAVTEYLPSRHALLKETGIETNALLLSKRDGKRLTVRSVTRLVKIIGCAKGLLNITPIKLRGAYATHMLEGGAPLSAVSRLLGHEKLETTMHYVGGVNWSRMRESYDRTFKR